MKRSAAVPLAMFVVLFAGWARADSVPGDDPRIGVGGGGGSFDITTLNFLIFSPSGTSPGTSACMITVNEVTTSVPDCEFGNDTGFRITQLTFVIGGNSITAGGFHCSVGLPFSQCTINSDGTLATFSGGPGLSSGGLHDDIVLSLVGWSPNTGFAGTFTPIPEPAGLTLLVGGFAALVARRKLWKARTR